MNIIASANLDVAVILTLLLLFFALPVTVAMSVLSLVSAKKSERIAGSKVAAALSGNHLIPDSYGDMPVSNFDLASSSTSPQSSAFSSLIEDMTEPTVGPQLPELESPFGDEDEGGKA